MLQKIPRALWIALPLAYLLFFYHLTAVGLIGPDEPRYASIGREMAASGDWITPRLGGKPWFEKPALLYWMQAVGYRAGLGAELAPRLPVALMAVAFLALYWWILNRELGCLPARFATAILGTTAAWIVCSQVSVTDLPLTATYSAAMLLALPWVLRRDPGYLPWVSALLGLAVLAKGPAPLILAAPILVPWSRFRTLKQSRDRAGAIEANSRAGWWDALIFLRPRILLPFLIVALPWYVLCTVRNGRAFLIDFLWKHNVERFVSANTLLHGQPFWFFGPVLLGALLPWTPLAAVAAVRSFRRDPLRLFLLAWVLLVLGFFSVSANKLPGYILPLVPAVAALMGMALHELDSAAGWLAACAVLLVLFPIAAPMLSVALPAGLSRATFPPFQWIWVLPLAVAAAAWKLERRRLRLAAVLCIAAGATAGVVFLKYTAAPDLNRTDSARDLWQQIAPNEASICVEFVPRGVRPALDYYSVKPLPSCADQPRPLWLGQAAGQEPHLTPKPVRR